MTVRAEQLYPEGAAILAPVAGHSDLPMRLAVRRYGCRFAFTEMVDAGSLVYAVKKSEKMLARGESEDFLGVQIVGSEPEILKKAVNILNEREFSVIDFNLGCPAPKVARKCEGAMFALKKPDEAVKAFSVIAENSRFPVSVKMRILSETDPEPTVALAQKLEEAGASAITIHGRLMKNFYSGPVFHDVIKAVKDALKIPVIANGGALRAPLYHELLEKTTCTRGMIARGALGNPWIFSEIRGGLPPTLDEFAEELERYFRSMMDFYGRELAFRVSRKGILACMMGRGFPGQLRASASYLNSEEDFSAFMTEVRKGPVSKVFKDTGRVALC